jgi:hypothetical protein
MVMRNKTEIRHSLQLLILLQKLSSNKQDAGYAMLMASVMSILIFSMLSIYLFSSRLYKSTANAMVDSGSTFYAAEFSLNKRANQVRKKFNDYLTPTGVQPTGATVAAQMANCFGSNAATKGSGDFACIQDVSNYNEAVAVLDITDKKVSATNKVNSNTGIRYKNYSFVKPITGAGSSATELKVMTTGDYKGLRAIENRYRVYSTALKETTNAADGNVSAQSMLQMEFINRLIPVFQFAAFYENNLEFSPSGNMTVDGAVHTNSSLYFAPGGLLTINGPVTFTGDVYRSLSYVSGHSGVVRKVLLDVGGPYVDSPADCIGIAGKCINVDAAWGGSNLLISANDITHSNGRLKKQSKLQLPPIGFLSKVDSTGAPGEYYTKADLRVEYSPSRGGAIFKITRLDQSGAVPAVIETFSNDVINSLQKPVLMRVSTATSKQQFSEISRLCPKIDGAGNIALGEPTNVGEAMPTPSINLTADQRKVVLDEMQKAIAQMAPNAFTYTTTKSQAKNVFGVAFTNTLKANAKFSATPLLVDSVVNLPLREIAAFNTNNINNPTENGKGGCFLPPPMQRLYDSVNTGTDKNIYTDRKENRIMDILQSNIKSLTVWNRDGIYWDGAAPQSTANKLFARKPATPIGSLWTAPNPKAATDPVLGNANCDLVCLGLGAQDDTYGGMVWHYSMIDRAAPYNYVSGNGITRSDTAGLSPYGFAFSGGTRLPGAITIASDQAVYVQGDYNNPSNIVSDEDTVLDQSQFIGTSAAQPYPPASEKKPASFLADSLTILSNNCYNGAANYELSCLKPWNEQRGRATTTVVRAAILSGTEKAVVNAGTVSEPGPGLNNHIRMLEDWWKDSAGNSPATPSQTFKYRGSFVSQGIPIEFNAQYKFGCSGNTCNYNIPTRDFGFDTDFNMAAGLPPLTPRVVYLNQQVFKRDYDSQNR